MKLVFPGGEHPQVLLGPGVNRVGSDPQANIVLDRPGVMPQHCELHVTEHGVTLRVPPGTTVSVNNRAVDGLIALRPGDMVTFDRIHARLASIDIAQSMRQASEIIPANDDVEATAVRAVLPRYVLRGVSGESFGRSYALLGTTTLGRAPECNLRLDDTGLSRQHARLVPTAEGVRIEDLGSTNGSFINDKRVQRGVAVPGDEVGFDNLRFRLLAPGQAEPVQIAARSIGARKVLSPWLWVGIAAAVLAAIWVYALMR